MSISEGSVEDLLSRGVAAAHAAIVTGKPQDRDEAEFYLEWVLRTDVGQEQQMEAWYWLSRVVEDPQRRRECLENVLSIRPTHPAARRDMAVLEGRLKPEQMRADPLKQGSAVVPDDVVRSEEAKRFKCPKCGASMVANPELSVLQCQFCGTQVNEEGEEVQTPDSAPKDEVSEQDWIAAIHTDTGHRWALPQSRAMKCQGCSAVVTFAPGEVSAACPYCASPYVAMPTGVDADDLREPDGLIPFYFDIRAVFPHIRQWLSDQSRIYGVPGDLESLAALCTPSPVYLPFWSFDIGGEVNWRGWVKNDADIAGVPLDDVDNAMHVGGFAAGVFLGNFELAAQSAASMMAKRNERQGLIYAEGAVPVDLNDVLVPATQSLPVELLSRLTYETDKAVPYKDEALANWPAEIYSTSLSEASLSARQTAIKASDKEIGALTNQDVDDEDSTVKVDRSTMTVISYKLLLLPVWAASYTYKGDTYRIVINGQSGQVEGNVPRKQMHITDRLITGLLGR